MNPYFQNLDPPFLPHEFIIDPNEHTQGSTGMPENCNQTQNDLPNQDTQDSTDPMREIIELLKQVVKKFTVLEQQNQQILSQLQKQRQEQRNGQDHMGKQLSEHGTTLKKSTYRNDQAFQALQSSLRGFLKHLSDYPPHTAPRTAPHEPLNWPDQSQQSAELAQNILRLLQQSQSQY
ncbi:hypothetical protein Alg130_11056 [Pyrenophora tritici-repentis]|nr:hypothetical protein Alg130_11056 [Pyrenophora tritici-repentis]